MLRFRVDAINRLQDGSTEIVATHRFSAGYLVEAEALADEWASSAGLCTAHVDSLRIVCAEMIAAERAMEAYTWSRSNWRHRWAKDSRFHSTTDDARTL